MKEQAQKMGLEWSRLNQQQQQFVAELAYKEKALQQERELKEAALALEREQIASTLKSGKTVDGMSYVQELNTRFLTTDPVSGNKVISDPQGLRNAIIALGLPDSETDKLLLYYGLPIN